VNRNPSLLAAVFSLVDALLGHLTVSFILPPGRSGRRSVLKRFKAQQSKVLALMFLKLHAQGYNISMVLFDSYNLLIGCLIFRPTFLPHILGVLLAISGLCYLINCFTNFISPVFAAHLSPYILIPVAAELLLALWFVVMGVNGQRWRSRPAQPKSSDRSAFSSSFPYQRPALQETNA
jgi:hypothetical protein